MINFEAFQRATGSFQTVLMTGNDPAADGTDEVADWTVTGQASFYQNPFTGSNSKYKITLTGMTSGDNYYISLVDICDGTAASITDETVSSLLIFSTS